jgi:hypothetical protein
MDGFRARPAARVEHHFLAGRSEGLRDVAEGEVVERLVFGSAVAAAPAFVDREIAQRRRHVVAPSGSGCLPCSRHRATYRAIAAPTLQLLRGWPLHF